MIEPKFFSVESIKIEQFQENEVRIGKMKFGELIKIVRFSNREVNPYNPLTQKEELTKFAEKNFFQRHWDENRLSKISRFIEKELNKNADIRIPIFPTPIIISLDRNFEIEEELNDEDFNNLNLEWEKQDSCFIIGEKIIIPNAKNLALIVDGQHRLKGIEEYIKRNNNLEKINDLELSIIFLINLDLFRLGEVFANINFEQKTVNKSIYYDIFGTLPLPLSPEKLCHDVILMLNNDEDSPLFHKINLLGRGDGFISQAQITDLIVKYFRENSIWNNYYRDFSLGGVRYKEVYSFLKIYFEEIKNIWASCYPQSNDKKEYQYILLKSTGIGALLRLIKWFPKIEYLDENKIRLEVRKHISKISDEVAKKLFTRDGEFGSAGSYGLQSKLARRLRRIMFGIDEKKPW